MREGVLEIHFTALWKKKKKKKQFPVWPPREEEHQTRSWNVF